MRISPASAASSSGVSSAKSVPASRSARLASAGMPGPSSSSPSGWLAVADRDPLDAELAACARPVRRLAVRARLPVLLGRPRRRGQQVIRRGLRPARAGPPAPVGGSSPTGPKNASNTRRSGSTWASAVTSVASAHRYSWYRVAGRATVTAAGEPLAAGRIGGHARTAQRRAEPGGEQRQVLSSPSLAAAANPAARSTCRSSEYFSTTPAVCSAVASSTRSAPSTTSASAQLIASATPGGLARSRSRSRATPLATWLASGAAAAGTRRRMMAATRSVSG